MTQTLKQELLDEISIIDARCEQLSKNFLEYKDKREFELAIRCDVKYRELKTVSNRLKKIIIKTSK
jgi:hypothetical protein